MGRRGSHAGRIVLFELLPWDAAYVQRDSADGAARPEPETRRRRPGRLAATVLSSVGGRSAGHSARAAKRLAQSLTFIMRFRKSLNVVDAPRRLTFSICCYPRPKRLVTFTSHTKPLRQALRPLRLTRYYVRLINIRYNNRDRYTRHNYITSSPRDGRFVFVNIISATVLASALWRLAE